MPTAWFRLSFLRMMAVLGAMLVVLSGCHFHHHGGYGYYRGGYHHGGGYHHKKRHGHHGHGHHGGGWHGRY